MNTFEAFIDELEKIAWEDQTYEIRDGKVHNVYRGSNLSTMTMARAAGVKPKAHPEGGYEGSRVLESERARKAARDMVRQKQQELDRLRFWKLRRRRRKKKEIKKWEGVEKTAVSCDWQAAPWKK